MLFDSKSYWSLPRLIRISLLTAKSSHAAFAFLDRSLSEHFKDASGAPKLILGEYYIKNMYWFRLLKWSIYVGVESGAVRDTAVKNDTASWAISFSGSKRNIWSDSGPKNTNPAKETTGVGSRQPSKQTPPALLASVMICSKSYSVSQPTVLQQFPNAEETYYTRRRVEIKSKRWKKVQLQCVITETHPMNTLHCYLFGHCTYFSFGVIHQPRVRNSLLYLASTSLACSLSGYRGSWGDNPLHQS